MRLNIKGDIKLDKIGGVISEVTKDIFSSIESAQGDGEIIVNNPSIELAFVVDGYEEPVKLTIKHDIGIEPFTVEIEVDEDGTVVKSKDNKDTPIYDEVYHKLARGEEIELPTEPIESKYKDEELEELDVIEGGDLKGIRYQIIGSDIELLRYYNNGILVVEATLMPKDKE